MTDHSFRAIALPDLDMLDLGTLTRTQPEHALAIAAMIHDGLYRECFPIEEEQEPFEAWADALLGRATGGPRMTFIVLGIGLHGPDPEPLAFMIGEFYPHSSCALLTYSARKKSAPRKLGGRLLAETLDGLRRAAPSGLRGVFSECNDPEKVEWNPDDGNARDVMSPSKRIALFAAAPYHMRRINADYHQPPLEPGSHGCGDLILFGLPGTEDPSALRDFLEEFQAYLTRDFVPASQDVTAMARCLAQVDDMISGERPMYTSLDASPKQSSKRPPDQGKELLLADPPSVR